ncbi:Modification methylase BamHI [Anaerolineales bacterium]|nr:Modification methylase BamHI [Anaerolineales bacterium]
MPKPISQNTLFYGDNLSILREHFPDECVDLIYLDPPFNSSRSYNVLFKDESGAESDAQITAFEDTWHWGADAEQTYHEMVQNAPANVAQMIGALREFVGTNQMMAYLVMMAARLTELHRVLKPTGSLYLHCDPTASHYLKIILDTIFGVENFVNEIAWKRSDAHSDAKQGAKHYGRVHDILLFYVKNEDTTFNSIYGPLPQSTIDNWYRNVEPETGRRYNKADLTGPGGASKGNPHYEWKGITRYWRYSRENMEKLEAEGRIVYSKSGMPYQKRYLDESKGVAVQDWWDDIQMLRGIQDNGERLGYPTQKPLALLERIIQVSSNEGDVVLDPFCGCGTAIAAAQKLNRRWVGIDVTHLSISLMKYRMKDMFDLQEKRDYQVIGEPEDVQSARQLAKDDRYQFQWWALSLVQAKPLGGTPTALSGTSPKSSGFGGGREGVKGARIEGKKGSDKGIDGVINFIDEKNKTGRVLIQVKSGHVKSGDVRDLRGVLDREEAALGVFITLEEPSKDMTTEAVSSGWYHSDLWQKDYPRIQILTIEDLLNGKGIDMPKSVPGQFKQAEKVKKKEGQQGELGI